MGELYAELGLDDTKFNNKLKDAGVGLNKFGDNMIKAGKGMTMKVTAPLVGLGTAAIMTVSKFNDSMSQVSAISGATGEDLEALREQAKELGATTAHSASAAADAMGYLALAGWDTNQILAATPDMLDLATAAAMDLATAADIVSDTMSAFGMDATRAGEAADIFAKTSMSANTNVEQLGEALKYAGPTANAAGMDLAKTSAVLGVLADNGIKGSKAGTTFNAMLRDMKNEAVDGKVAVGDMSVALYNADGTMRDLGSVMADVGVATKDMTTMQRDMALGAIFGEQAIKGVNIMLTEGAEKYSDLEDAIYDSNGAAKEAAQIMGDNIGGAFREMKSAIEGAAISFGEVLEPHIRKAAEFVANLAGRFANLDDRTKKIIVAVAAVAAAIGPLLIAFGMIAKVVALVGAGIAAVTAGPFVLIIGAIAALVAGLVYAYNNVESFRNIIQTVFSAIGFIINATMNFAKNVIKRTTEAITVWWETWGEDILEFFKDTWDSVAEVLAVVIELIIEGIKLFIKLFTKLWETYGETIMEVWRFVWDIVKGLTEVAWNLIKGIVGAALQFLKGIFDTFIGLITGDWERMWQGLENVAKSISNVIITIMEAMLNAAITIINAFINQINRVIDALNRVPGVNIPNVPNLEKVSLPKLAKGGHITSSGIAMVGEEGPEIVKLNKGASVIPLNNKDKNGGGYKTANIVVMLDGEKIAQAVGEPFVDEIRVRTGMAV